MTREKKLWRFCFKNYLEEKEKIFFVIRRHPILHIKQFAVTFFFGLFIPFAVWFLFPQLLIFTIIWGIIGLIRFCFEFIIWYYEAWLITNMSIVDIDWKSPFEKSAVRLEYHHIETITYEIKGFLATIFNYGDMTVEKTSGNLTVFNGVFSPKRMVKKMTEYQEKLTKIKAFRDHSTLRNLLSDMLSNHAANSPSSEDILT